MDRKHNSSTATTRKQEQTPLLVPTGLTLPRNVRSQSVPLPLPHMAGGRRSQWHYDDDGEDYDHDHDNDEEEDEHIGVGSLAAFRQQTMLDLEPELAVSIVAQKPLFHVPYFPWLSYRGYFKKDVWKDLMAGVVVSVVAIPQGLAYAVLASLPAQMGLYTSFLPPLVYGLLGTSRHLSAGPVALVSMFIPTIAVTLHVAHDPEMRIAVAAMSSIVSGVLLVVVGICRLGSLVKFISSPVLNGFTSAAAVVIGINQMQHLVGFPLPDSTYNVTTVVDLFRGLPNTNPVSFILGFITAVYLAVIRWYSKHKKYKKIKWIKNFNIVSTLLAVMIATVASYFLTKNGYKLKIVGEVPPGLPHFSVPSAAVQDLAGMGDLVMACLPVTCLAFMSSWSLARNYATKSGQHDLDANQEAVAIGAANAVAGFFMCFPSSGSFGRTSMNASNGARSPLSNISAGLAVLICLVFLTPYLYYLPMACLGAIIEISLISLFDLKPFKKAYRISMPDFVVTITTFLFTVVVNIEVGLIVGIFVSIAVLLQELSEVHTSVMHLVPSGGGRYLVRSESVDPLNPDVDDMGSSAIKVVRLTASLFFGNNEEMKTAFEELLEPSAAGGEGEAGQEVKAIVVDASGVSHLDLSGIEAVEHLCKLAEEKKVKLAFVNSKGVFRDRLKASKLWSKVGGDEYEQMSVDEVATKLFKEFGVRVPPAANGNPLRWGSPIMGAAAAPSHSQYTPVLPSSLLQQFSSKGRLMHDSVIEGDEGEEENGDNSRRKGAVNMGTNMYGSV